MMKLQFLMNFGQNPLKHVYYIMYFIDKNDRCI